MGVNVVPASGLKRTLAVFIDWIAITVVSIAVALVPHGSLFLGTLVYLLIDVVLTAFWGLSAGRFATRIRVVRFADGGQPGLWPAFLRTLLVALTGWIGFIYYLLSLRIAGAAPPRVWWDSAAGTLLVAAPPKA